MLFFNNLIYCSAIILVAHVNTWNGLAAVAALGIQTGESLTRHAPILISFNCFFDDPACNYIAQHTVCVCAPLISIRELICKAAEHERIETLHSQVSRVRGLRVCQLLLHHDQTCYYWLFFRPNGRGFKLSCAPSKLFLFESNRYECFKS